MIPSQRRTGRPFVDLKEGRLHRMPNTKTVHLKSYLAFLHERGGADDVERVLAELTPEDREIAVHASQAGEWLDCDRWWRLLTTADRVLGCGDLQLVREIGAFDAKRNLSGVYRVFLSFLTPDFIMSRASLIWKQYYDTGRIEVVRIGKQDAEFRLLEFPGLPLRHEAELIGWMEEAIRMTGRPRTRLEHPGPCLARGDAYCQFLVRWD